MFPSKGARRIKSTLFPDLPESVPDCFVCFLYTHMTETLPKARKPNIIQAPLQAFNPPASKLLAVLLIR
jgi:hypothetical protein